MSGRLTMADVSLHASRIEGQTLKEKVAQENEWRRAEREENEDLERTSYASYVVETTASATDFNLSDPHKAFMIELVKTLCLEMGRSVPGKF